jgi:hypothetical protein
MASQLFSEDPNPQSITLKFDDNPRVVRFVTTASSYHTITERVAPVWERARLAPVFEGG